MLSRQLGVLTFFLTLLCSEVMVGIGGVEHHTFLALPQPVRERLQDRNRKYI